MAFDAVQLERLLRGEMHPLAVSSAQSRRSLVENDVKMIERCQVTASQCRTSQPVKMYNSEDTFISVSRRLRLIWPVCNLRHTSFALLQYPAMTGN